MNRRDFLTRLGLGAAAVALSPLLDLAEVIAPPAVALDAGQYVYQIKFMMNVYVRNPRTSMVLTGICD